MLAAVDLSPVTGLLIGAVLVVASAWYWHRLGNDQIEASRRAIRRASLILGVLAIFALVRAASFVDSEVSPQSYIVAWLSALGLVFLVVLLIAIDMFNSFRLHHRELQRETLETAQRLKTELEARAARKALPDEGPGGTE